MTAPMADDQRQHADYVSVRATDLNLVLQAADGVEQWSHAEWAARCRIVDAFHDASVRPPWWEYDPNWKPEDDSPVFDPWPDNLPLEAQVKRLSVVLLEHYQQTFDRSEGAMEKAARLLWERAQFDGADGHG